MDQIQFEYDIALLSPRRISGAVKVTLSIPDDDHINYPACIVEFLPGCTANGIAFKGTLRVEKQRYKVWDSQVGASGGERWHTDPTYRVAYASSYLRREGDPFSDLPPGAMSIARDVALLAAERAIAENGAVHKAAAVFRINKMQRADAALMTAHKQVAELTEELNKAEAEALKAAETAWGKIEDAPEAVQVAFGAEQKPSC